jgi:hypothetical protein
MEGGKLLISFRRLFLESVGEGPNAPESEGPNAPGLGCNNCRIMAKNATFLLLHGTFARGARWTLPDSPLCRRIEDVAREVGIAADIRAVPWSGRNRARDRIAAGRELEQILLGIDREVSPEVFLIGHSHGGSAIAHFLTNRRVEDPEISGCVFLSTPFIVARVRPDAFLTYSSLLVIAAIVGFVAIDILLSILIGGALTLMFENYGGSNLLAIAIEGTALILVGLALGRQPKIYRRLIVCAREPAGERLPGQELLSNLACRARDTPCRARPGIGGRDRGRPCPGRAQKS